MDERLWCIQKGAEYLSWVLKDQPEREQPQLAREVLKRFKQLRRYSQEELNSIADGQLLVLSERLNFLVKEGNIKEKKAGDILEALRQRKSYLIEILKNSSFWNNSEGHYLPIVPVVTDRSLNISILMKLIVNDDKIGRSLIPDEKIKNKLKEPGPKCYWIVDARVDSNYGYHSLTIAEAIAYALHNPSVLKYTLAPEESRYKGARKFPRIHLRLVDEYPVLYWSKNDYFEFSGSGMVLNPVCESQRIH